jgi:conjugative relaxase-like TrwC/TraI family protein
VLTIRSMAGGEGYAQRHLQQSDYYDQKRTVEGQWHGRGAELLGLSGRVSSEDFESLRQGLDPETGEFLPQRQGSDRISADGAEQSKARSLYDMTFSAPKSVSVMAIVGGDERLIAAHETAVRETLQEAEKYAATRVRLEFVTILCLRADALQFSRQPMFPCLRERHLRCERDY